MPKMSIILSFVSECDFFVFLHFFSGAQVDAYMTQHVG